MRYNQLERKIAEIRRRLSAQLNDFQAVILACYADDYSQKKEIEIEDAVPGVLMEDLLPYGIRYAGSSRSAIVYNRSYLIFIDRHEDVIDEETFDAFSNAFASEYLPKGAALSIFVLNFNIDEYSKYSAYVRIIEAKYPGIRTLFTLSLLRKQEVQRERRDEKLSIVKGKYKTFVFSDVVFAQLTSFMRNSSHRPVDYILLFKDRLDKLAAVSLQQVTLIVTDCIPKSEDIDYLTLALAYFTFYYKIPVMVDGLLKGSYISALRKFYCSYDVYTAYDRIYFLKHYPKFCYSRRSILDFWSYIPPEERELTAVVEYIKGDEVKVEEIDLLSCRCYPLVKESNYQQNLETLEKRSLHQNFLHVGNCLYAHIGSYKQLIYLRKLQPKFQSIVSSCDETVPPFKKELNLSQLINMLPCSGVTCHEDETGKSSLHRFARILSQLASKKQIPPISVKGGMSMYLPEYAKDGLGPIITEFTRLHGGYNKFVGISEDMANRYSYFNVKMRNEVIDQISNTIPLKNLRKYGNYLTIWGAVGALPISADLFKSAEEG